MRAGARAPRSLSFAFCHTRTSQHSSINLPRHSSAARGRPLLPINPLCPPPHLPHAPCMCCWSRRCPCLARGACMWTARAGLHLLRPPLVRFPHHRPHMPYLLAQEAHPILVFFSAFVSRSTPHLPHPRHRVDCDARQAPSALFPPPPPLFLDVPLLISLFSSSCDLSLSLPVCDSPLSVALSSHKSYSPLQ